MSQCGWIYPCIMCGSMCFTHDNKLKNDSLVCIACKTENLEKSYEKAFKDSKKQWDEADIDVAFSNSVLEEFKKRRRSEYEEIFKELRDE